MKIVDLFSLSTRMFRTRPTRTWLTILGISVGISAVLFLVALGYGLQSVILEKIVFNQALLSLTVTPANEIIVFNDKAVGEIRQIPKVADIAPQATFTGQAVFGSLYGTLDLHAVDANFFDYAGISTFIGEVFDESESDQIIVSAAVLKLFGIEDPQSVLGKQLNIQVVTVKSDANTSSPGTVLIPHPFTVKGVIEDLQGSYAYIPLKEIAKYVPLEEYDQVRVKVESDKDLIGVEGVIIEKGFQVASLSDTIEQANKIFQIVQIVLGLFGAVALVVSSIGMFNTMTVTLLERTNEIGIMRALGANKPNLKHLFLAESIIIGLLGGVVGVLLGFIFAALFNLGVNSLANHFGGASIDLFYFPNWFLGGIIALSAIIGFLSGVFPARRAANLEPLEALRYK